jgi:hypothetical protein
MKGDIFNIVKYAQIGSNVFDLSHSVKASFMMGRLYPTVILDAVPGDKFTIRCENFLRFLPLVSPVMHEIKVTTHFFFVPNRLLWPTWERFITGDLDVEHPYSTPAAHNTNSLGCYMQYPIGMPTGTRVNPMPVAAYNLIWDEYYRDQNLQDERFTPLVDGLNNINTDFTGTPARRAWNHDYFTSCLPFAQKGDAVELPLLQNNTAPVSIATGTGNPGLLRKTTDDTVASGAGDALKRNASGQLKDTTVNQFLYYDPNGTLFVNVDNEAVDINTVRRAFRLQEWLERNSRGGTRYIENIAVHFGVSSSDKRLQRPEYIGGSKQKMVISEVLSTAQTDPSGSQEFPVGYLAGHGISAGGSNGRIQYFCEEHGWLIGIINIQPVTAYYQGIPRKYSRFDRFDYYWPSFSNIGEQEILNKEIYVNTSLTTEQMDGTFGYLPRYAEYKYENDKILGEMQDTLEHWHLGRKFSGLPALNDGFIQCTPSNRIFVDTTAEADHIVAHLYHDIKAVRKMPKFGIPSI